MLNQILKEILAETYIKMECRNKNSMEHFRFLKKENLKSQHVLINIAFLESEDGEVFRCKSKQAKRISFKNFDKYFEQITEKYKNYSLTGEIKGSWNGRKTKSYIFNYS